MFHFDSADSHFQNFDSKHSRNISNATIDDTWISPGFAGAREAYNPHQKGVRELANTAENEIASQNEINNRRKSVVLQGQKALLITDESESREKQRSDTQVNGVIKAISAIKLQVSEQRSRSKSPAKGKKKKRSKTPATPKVVDEGIVVSSSSSEADRKGNDFPSSKPQPITFPKRLTPPRSSNISSLSTSFQESRNAFPQLSLDISKATEHLKTKLASLVSDKAPQAVSDSYEVPLEENFVSPDVYRKSPLASMYATETLEEKKPKTTTNDTHKMCAEDFEPLRMLGKGS